VRTNASEVVSRVVIWNETMDAAPSLGLPQHHFGWQTDHFARPLLLRFMFQPCVRVFGQYGALRLSEIKGSFQQPYIPMQLQFGEGLSM
jgi:hypothetical protein